MRPLATSLPFAVLTLAWLSSKILLMRLVDTTGMAWLLGGGMDYTLLSFADSKIVSGDGGMLLFSGKVPAESVNKINTLIPVTAPYMPSPGLALSLRNLVHGLADLRREHPAANVAPAFCAVAKNYRDLIVCSGGIGDAASVATGFSGLDAVRISRYRNYVRYREGISIGHAKVVPLHKGSTCWRCPVLFDEADRARHITKALRSAGIHCVEPLLSAESIDWGCTKAYF